MEPPALKTTSPTNRAQDAFVTEIGRLFRHARLHKGLSLLDLARHADLRDNELRQLEQGLRALRIDRLALLAHALGGRLHLELELDTPGAGRGRLQTPFGPVASRDAELVATVVRTAPALPPHLREHLLAHLPWVQQTLASASPSTPAPAPAPAPPRADLKMFAALVIEVAHSVPEAGCRDAGRVLIYALWQQLGRRGLQRLVGGSIGKFRARLLQAQDTGRVVLVGATAADDLDERTATLSQTPSDAGTFHFLVRS